MKRKTVSSEPKVARGESQFYAEGEYADSIVRKAMGDIRGSVAALKRALEVMPTYAPAIFSMGTVEYQSGKIAKGRKLFMSLLSLPKTSTGVCEMIDEAGMFLTRMGEFEDGMAVYRMAVEKYPGNAALLQGLGYCASNAGLHDEAISANRRALELEPENQELVNDLGWALCQAGRFAEASEILERAVSMDPKDELASENLRRCVEEIARSKKGARRRKGGQ